MYFGNGALSPKFTSELSSGDVLALRNPPPSTRCAAAERSAVHVLYSSQRTRGTARAAPQSPTENPGEVNCGGMHSNTA